MTGALRSSTIGKIEQKVPAISGYGGLAIALAVLCVKVGGLRKVGRIGIVNCGIMEVR